MPYLSTLGFKVTQKSVYLIDVLNVYGNVSFTT